MEMIDLCGKTAVVTGATGGIGTEVCRIFHKCGAKVVGLHVNPEKKNLSYVDYVVLDIRNSDECREVFDRLIERYGRIDILVNCAGITRDAMTGKMTEEQFDSVIETNLKGVWNLTRLAGPHMRENHGGSIVNVSSVVGIYGNIGQANYAASKAGIIGLTKSWAKEFALKGGNVRVNAVAPGYTLTDMVKTVPKDLLEKFAKQTMLGRLAEPAEIAGTILYLASDLSSYVTGEVINVNGGMRL